MTGEIKAVGGGAKSSYQVIKRKVGLWNTRLSARERKGYGQIAALGPGSPLAAEEGRCVI